jgi:hypothetical protein
VTPSGTRGVLNDAISIYFADVTLAGAFCHALVRQRKGRDGRRRLPDAR